jgi:hypothetical protein
MGRGFKMCQMKRKAFAQWEIIAKEKKYTANF